VELVQNAEVLTAVDTIATIATDVCIHITLLILQEVLHNVFTWYAVINPQDPNLG
jgi:hypothetical protein